MTKHCPCVQQQLLRREKILSGTVIWIILQTSFSVIFLDRRSPAKRPKLVAVTQDDQRTINCDLVSMLNAPNTVKVDNNKEQIMELPQALSIFAAVTPVCQKLDQYAVDWSLKTRVRFTSKTPFAFSSTLKVKFLFWVREANDLYYDFYHRRQRRLPE